MKTIKRWNYLAAAAASFASGGALAASMADVDDLFDLSIEELVNLEVTSVNRSPERLSDATSAVYVITREDIERHGIRSIPDALRLAPGISVSQIDASKWAISGRGFGGRFSNKLLVLQDGRQLYSPSFSGVYWESQHTLIEEIERIEVIRGPGAVVWGTNAVNGVINIITAKSNADRGGDVIGGLSPDGGTFAGLRYSNALSEQASFRTFLHYSEGNDTVLADGSDAADDWDMVRASFRGDWKRADSNISLTVEAYDGEMGNTRQYLPSTPPYFATGATVTDVSGAFLLADWSYDAGQDSTYNAQLYLDSADRLAAIYGEDRFTSSAEIQHRRRVGKHDLSVGASIRHSSFDFVPSATVSFGSATDSNTVVSAYIQDEYWMAADRFSVTAGLKLESNNYSPDDIEWMPTLRLLWKPSESHSVWAAVTRAVRTPSVGDQTVVVTNFAPTLPPLSQGNPFPLPFSFGSIGNPDFESENAFNIEVGIRGQIRDNLSYDLALFTVDYDKVRSLTPPNPLCLPSGTPVAADPACLFTSTSVLGQTFLFNEDSGASHGGEIAIDWQVRQDLRLRSTISVANDRQITDNPLGGQLGSLYPELQGNLQVLWSPQDDLAIALLARYVDDIEASFVESYWQANLNVRWKFRESWTVSFGVRNFLDDGNVEFVSDLNELQRSGIERTAFANIRYAF